MLTLLGNLIPTPDTVQHEVYLGDGEDGPQWAAPVARKARMESASKKIQTGDGRVVVLTGKVFLLGHEGSVKVQDRIDGRTVEVVDTPTWWDGTPMHHEAGVS